MLQKFQNHTQQNFSFLKEKKLLVAVSGGMDSMLLVDLFQKFQDAISNKLDLLIV